MKHGYSNNNSGGATQPKTGKQYVPLCRSKQYSTAMDAMMNKTRSGHQHSSMNYHYQGISDDQGGNVHGYRPE